MWIVVLIVIVVVAAVYVAGTVRRGRTSRYPTVEDRPPGRD